jgi:hypothetical protein
MLPPVAVASPRRGYPSEYWWCWAAVGFVLGSLAIIELLFVATLTFIGGEPLQAGHHDVMCGEQRSSLLQLLGSRTPPARCSAAAAPRERRTITPEALEEFKQSRTQLLTPDPSTTGPVRGRLARPCGDGGKAVFQLRC